MRYTWATGYDGLTQERVDVIDAWIQDFPVRGWVKIDDIWRTFADYSVCGPGYTKGVMRFALSGLGYKRDDRQFFLPGERPEPHP